MDLENVPPGQRRKEEKVCSSQENEVEKLLANEISSAKSEPYVQRKDIRRKTLSVFQRSLGLPCNTTQRLGRV